MGGIIGGGGGGSSSSSTSQAENRTEVTSNVTVQNWVDLRPVADVVNKLTDVQTAQLQESKAFIQQVADASTATTKSMIDAFKTDLDTRDRNALVIAGLSAAAGLFLRWSR